MKGSSGDQRKRHIKRHMQEAVRENHERKAWREKVHERGQDDRKLRSIER